MIFPAIDLQNGQSVRLFQGDFNQRTLIEQSPAVQAENFEKAHVGYLHLVDLDGAKTGKPQNATVITNIRQAFSGLLELGGGIRNLATVDYYLDLGIDRVIIGSAALSDPTFVKAALKKYGPNKIVIGIDGQNGEVAVNGWVEQTQTKMTSLIAQIAAAGAKVFIVTDVSRDGTLTGPNFDLLAKLQRQFDNCTIVASGGIRNLTDIKQLQQYQIKDVIVGKALFVGGISLKEIAEVNASVS
ncbi:MAG: 1-(5-phosphoribosyl)-5-[(5-phosphoribosylamino)methylideneamino]imidazole-4-carboxamide isomerase [Liquorilactobacillus nagelii]|jgi:phosphoribosylformimino-5-aminoimidazole carboxamide ribotide isomerase|uniref:1-(5-phosphoribosyl)-5-[(5- phosphoribosylamino)methylideneamino]imidazole-4- carboxamide isomerase n=1 Tax=Liquorilactobacillus nagelii TaxID=82688 RepID=UPI0024315243|nr:1-(5-phosphoribosyl)-5-[(5-phosphoribosylamino)methylideneamino]imidazole-4-carboxamide isomerase [Liquorilactobacillus nagelii]MCI1634242.1 1-(5-phosphoribosyl)-5-[(5-phosphoribosylamino)methylideneamino]imidazole-4-carboxamide isomerase [Liquorilactobacillus nagelii]MCI1921309.1 1-(5-phosphoribosyl)-5-[(5-phosphoribosylamino)methylideneamino]imidazole-4-carboxamide isomerase [Liquorilactobacillus nagelii]MCI1977317.1 1-(5-phosphoribosyl)-5-[(5-phosphoribosylamino)methylideneamino]imidazole-